MGHSKNILFVKNLFIFRERRRDREREEEKHHCVVASHAPLTADLACNPGTCPNWALISDPFIHRPVLNPLSYTIEGSKNILKRQITSITHLSQETRKISNKKSSLTPKGTRKRTTNKAQSE